MTDRQRKTAAQWAPPALTALIALIAVGFGYGAVFDNVKQIPVHHEMIRENREAIIRAEGRFDRVGDSLDRVSDSLGNVDTTLREMKDEYRGDNSRISQDLRRMEGRIESIRRQVSEWNGD